MSTYTLFTKWDKLGISPGDVEFLGMVTENHSIRILQDREFEGPEGFFSDKRDVRQVKKQMEQGGEAGEWAWCTVTVQIVEDETDEVVGENSLGGCSYKNERDFISGGYFMDMVREAWEEAKTRSIHV